MNTNILRYSLFGVAEGQEIDYTFVKFTVYFVYYGQNRFLMIINTYA